MGCKLFLLSSKMLLFLRKKKFTLSFDKMKKVL